MRGEGSAAGHLQGLGVEEHDRCLFAELGTSCQTRLVERNRGTTKVGREVTAQALQNLPGLEA